MSACAKLRSKPIQLTCHTPRATIPTMINSEKFLTRVFVLSVAISYRPGAHLETLMSAD